MDDGQLNTIPRRHRYEIDKNVDLITKLSENAQCTFIRRLIHASDNPNVLVAALEKIIAKLRLMNVAEGSVVIDEVLLEEAMVSYLRDNPKWYLTK